MIPISIHSTDLSAIALTPDGSLWLGSDESLTVERLSPIAPNTYGKHHSFPIGEYMEALKDDEHLGPFLTFPLPGKENGFDIEGFAIHSRGHDKPTRVFLGLRGPVLRGPVLRGGAMMLGLELEEQESGGSDSAKG